MSALDPTGGGDVDTPRLTEAMRAVLWRAQRDLYDGAPVVAGHGMTMRGLRQRGLVEGAMPHARLTNKGRVIAAEIWETAQ